MIANKNMVDCWNVEAITRNGTPVYLAHINGLMLWVLDAEMALEYDDEEEADADAIKYDGEVFHFQRPAR